jgi:uncharacterized membrane protein
MRRIVFSDLPLAGERASRWPARIQLALFGLFLIQLAFVWAGLLRPGAGFGQARWPEGLLLVLAAAVVVGNLSLRLPVQNVILASLVIGVISAAIAVLGVQTGVPFGPYAYTERIGQELFHPLPWSVPLVWLVAILASRGTARVILRPWRRSRNYGFLVMGLSIILIVAFDLGLEPFATVVKRYWVWNKTKLPMDWYGAPWSNFVGWGVTSVVILAFVTPILIPKSPRKRPPSLYPLGVWLLVQVLFATGAVVGHLRRAALLGFVCTLMVAGAAAWGLWLSRNARPADSHHPG